MTAYPQRKSPRLNGYDYTQAGAYFVTLCQQNRVSLFGEIADGELRLNAAGEMVCAWWERLPDKYPSLEIDHFVVIAFAEQRVRLEQIAVDFTVQHLAHETREQAGASFRHGAGRLHLLA